MKLLSQCLSKRPKRVIIMASNANTAYGSSSFARPPGISQFQYQYHSPGSTSTSTISQSDQIQLQPMAPSRMQPVPQGRQLEIARSAGKGRLARLMIFMYGWEFFYKLGIPIMFLVLLDTSGSKRCLCEDYFALCVLCLLYSTLQFFIGLSFCSATTCIEQSEEGMRTVAIVYLFVETVGLLVDSFVVFADYKLCSCEKDERIAEFAKLQIANNWTDSQREREYKKLTPPREPLLGWVFVGCHFWFLLVLSYIAIRLVCSKKPRDQMDFADIDPIAEAQLDALQFQLAIGSIG